MKKKEANLFLYMCGKIPENNITNNNNILYLQKQNREDAKNVKGSAIASIASTK